MSGVVGDKTFKYGVAGCLLQNSVDRGVNDVTVVVGLVAQLLYRKLSSHLRNIIGVDFHFEPIE